MARLRLLECLADGVRALMADDPPEVRDSVLALIQTHHRDTVLGMVAQAVSGALTMLAPMSSPRRTAMRYGPRSRASRKAVRP
jgi:hypothetical protein